MKRNLAKIICALMVVLMLAVLVPQVKLQAQAETVSLSTLLEGKTLSVLGDSISTYEGVSNGAGAETSNSTIAGNWKYYSQHLSSRIVSLFSRLRTRTRLFARK